MHAALLAVLCASTFAVGLTGEFVLDDQRAIVEHPVVQGTAPLAEAFSRTFWGKPLGADPPSFRPLATLSFALDHGLFGGSAAAAHVSSLLWYVGLVLCGWALARRWMSAGAAFLGMALFALMPVHVENVTSVVGRADTMGVLASVLALWALSPAIAQGSAVGSRRVAVAALACFGALLCKESTVALPAVVALLIEFRRRAKKDVSIARVHLPSLALVAVTGAYFVGRMNLQPTLLSYTSPDDVLEGATSLERAAYGVELVARYTRLFVFPVGLCTGRKFAEVYRPEHLTWTMAAGAAVLGLIGYASWRAYRAVALPLWAAALVAWFPISGLAVPIPESMADRFLLLPSLFVCLAAGPLLVVVGSRRWVGPALLVAALGAEAVLSGAQAQTWHDEGTLWTHAVRVCPSSIHNHFRYAEYLSEKGETAEALWHYAVASKGRNRFPYAWTHPAQQAERSMPVEQRLRTMHRLLGVSIEEGLWRSRLAAFLRNNGRPREARLAIETGPHP